ncbi:ABC transporter family substrate-binding protein [Stackebrandtia albiflava]|uniref:ABC transporter family substrate-binding protein n=1 Tax=Stackebrandtia albiflava TaxID=406432 RepID=UPI001315366B|nr:ABC transporter family substrate-binding protein [Stackebrandtia albiflava]
MRKQPAALVAAGVAAALALSACSGDDSGDGGSANVGGLEACVDDPNNCNAAERRDGGELTWALSSGWDAWNGNTAAGNSLYLTQVMAGTRIPTGEFLPDGTYQWPKDLLTAAPELISESPMQVRYEIRPEAKWDDGNAIDLDDFLFHWYGATSDADKCDQELCDPAAISYGDNVESIEEVDGGIVVSYVEGYTDPEWSLGVPVSLPAHIADEQGFDWKNDPADMGAAAEFFNTTVPTWTAGPYKILPDSVEMGQSLSLVPNENWYGEIKPTLDKINLEVIAEQPTMLTALENGEIHGSEPASLDPDVAEQAGDLPGAVSAIGSRPAWDHLDFNLSNEFLSDIEVRKAIMTAISLEDIKAATYAELTETETRTNHIFPATSEYHTDVTSELGQGSGDVEAAKQILADAGYTLEGETLKTPEGEDIEPLSLVWLEGNTMREITMTLVQAVLKELGIPANLEPNAPDKLGTTLAERKFDIVEFGWIGSLAFTGAPSQYWHSGSASNYAGMKNDEIDAVIESVTQTTDLAEAAARANEAAKMVAEQYVILPVVTTPGLIVMSDQVANVRPNSSDQIGPFYNMEEWGFKAEG